MKRMLRTALPGLAVFMMIGLLRPIPAAAGCGSMTCPATHDGGTLTGGEVTKAEEGQILEWFCDYDNDTRLIISCGEIPVEG